jgi:hypothetical protein
MPSVEQIRSAAHWDQAEANFREALGAYSDLELQVLAIDLIERPHVVEIQGMSALAAIAVMYELHRREQA